MYEPYGEEKKSFKIKEKITHLKEKIQGKFRNDVKQKLSTCSSNLENMQSDLTKITLNYQTAQADFQACNEEKLTLSSDLNMVNEDLKKTQDKYDKLKDNYDSLIDDYNIVICNYAKNICGSGGMDYYYLDSNEKVVCCLDENTCAKDPDGKDIQKIEC